MEEWIIVAESQIREEAESQFDDWKKKNSEWFNKLNIQEELLIDTIRAIDKTCITRYRVRKK